MFKTLFLTDFLRLQSPSNIVNALLRQYLKKMNRLKKERLRSEDTSLKLQSRVCIKNSAVKASLCFILNVYLADTTSVFRLKFAVFFVFCCGIS